VPVILQTEAAECGLACLAMVAGAHGLQTDLAALRQRFSLSLKGLTLEDLVGMAGALGLQPRALRAELEQLPQLQRPSVLHWDLNHFVVLVALRRGRAVIHDPASGAREMALEEVSRHFTGIALELSPTADFRPRDERRRVTLTQLVGPVRGLARSLGQVLVLALALEFFVLLSPFLLQWVVDDVIVTGDRDLLLTLGLAFLGLVLVQAGTAAARSWAVLVLSATLNQQWLANVFAHLLKLPLPWFEKRHAGDIWSRFSAVQQIQRTLTTSFVEALLDGLLVLLTLVLMAVYSVPLALVASAAVLLYAVLRWLGWRPLRSASEEVLVHEANQASHFLESLRGMQAIKLFNAQADRQSRFASLVVAATNADVAARRLLLGVATGQRLLFGIERVLVVWLGARLVLDQQLSLGMLLAFIAYKEQFTQRCSALIDRGVELRMLRLQGERLADIVLSAPEDGSGSAVPAAASPSIELRDVSFRYADGEPEVLAGISLRIEPGESVAISGPSGCGKSTLLKLMLGLYPPTSGEILIGGVPLQRLGLAAWRSRVGAVMQDEPLFAGSVADNISFFSARPDSERVQECARLAAVHEDIEAMTMGYQTLVGDLGLTLSGGQKQRVLLARALYRRPQVLLLDEATSALDLERERAVNQAVRRLALTRVIVAHRPETVASAGRVIVLQHGRVVPPA
jgi:ATP-binding cassette subfamily B protein RaxB